MRNLLFKFKIINLSYVLIYRLIYKLIYRLLILIIMSIILSVIVFAEDLSTQMPGTTDAAKFKEEEHKDVYEKLKDLDKDEIIIPHFKEDQYFEIPKNASDIKLVLKNLKFQGMTLFSEKDVLDFYLPYLYNEITLDLIYKVAEKITRLYRDKGYFISKAYLPSQRINKGIVTINVIEGYIGEVELEDKFKQKYVIKKAINKILKEKPLNIKSLESFLLRLNDLPGYYFKSTLKPLNRSTNGAIQLCLTVGAKKAKGKISIDNSYSRFAGREGIAFSHSDSLFPLQQTMVSSVINNQFPIKNLNYAMLNHSIPISLHTTLDLSISSAKSYPGYILKSLDIKSVSDTISSGISYCLIRQRDHNLDFKLSINIKNSNSYTHDVLFTQDKIRFLKTTVVYDSHGNNSYSAINFTISKGLKILKASQKGEGNISRANAKPNFHKLELSLSHVRKISNNWSLILGFSSQYADSSLFSSEEFGYGGQTFGRAFDTSEISGDHGISGSIEIDYNKSLNLKPVNLVPYAFYDIGVVFRKDPNRKPTEKGASIGFGYKASMYDFIQAHVGLAWPLMRKIATPIYGKSQRDPRIFLQLSLVY